MSMIKFINILRNMMKFNFFLDYFLHLYLCIKNLLRTIGFNMKKLLGFVVLGLLLSGSAYAAKLEEANNEISSEWLKGKSINELLRNGFDIFRIVNSDINPSEKTAQYHLRTYVDGNFQIVVCFIDIEKTTCILP